MINKHNNLDIDMIVPGSTVSLSFRNNLCKAALIGIPLQPGILQAETAGKGTPQQLPSILTLPPQNIQPQNKATPPRIHNPLNFHPSNAFTGSPPMPNDGPSTATAYCHGCETAISSPCSPASRTKPSKRPATKAFSPSSRPELHPDKRTRHTTLPFTPFRETTPCHGSASRKTAPSPAKLAPSARNRPTSPGLFPRWFTAGEKPRSTPELIAYDPDTGICAPFTDSASADIAQNSDKSGILVPENHGWTVIGRADKYLPPCTVSNIRTTNGTLSFDLAEEGPFIIY